MDLDIIVYCKKMHNIKQKMLNLSNNLLFGIQFWWFFLSVFCLLEVTLQFIMSSLNTAKVVSIISDNRYWYSSKQNLRYGTWSGRFLHISVRNSLYLKWFYICTHTHTHKVQEITPPNHCNRPGCAVQIFNWASQDVTGLFGY